MGTEKLIVKNGTYLTMTSMLELVITGLAAQKWTCGKPTAWLNLSLLTPVKLKDNTDVKELNAEITLLMKNSMDLEKLLIPTQESPLSHNGSPLTVLQTVT